MKARIAATKEPTRFINIVEDPEQNLFPHYQKALLFKLPELVNRSAANQLIFTTHSPYIINYLTLALKGYTLLERMDQAENLWSKNSKSLKL